MPIVSIDPATGRVHRRFAEWAWPRVDRALDRALRAQGKWRAAAFGERARRMNSAARVLRADRRRFAELITSEMGKPIAQAEGEVEKCAWVCEHFAENAARILADEKVVSAPSRSCIRYEPLGVVLAVMPWNFPFWQAFRFAAPALMAGNVAVLKHAPNVPRCALAVEDVFRRAGFPAGVFQSVLVEVAAAERLVADPRVAAVSLTGGERAGRRVAAIAGNALKKTVLELGGSDPFVVLDDADLETTCRYAIEARVANSGQSCIAAKRFILERGIAPRFLDRFVRGMASLRVGDPFDAATEVGPLARGDLLARLEGQVRASVRRGAVALTGGKRLPGPGFYYAPTVLVGVRPGMPAYDDELFGPVASVIVARDARHAVRLANDTRFGLGASVWSRDVGRAQALAAEIQAGVVHVNQTVRSDPRLPFGGIKCSGYGRELGTHGLREFTNAKTVVIA